MARAQPERLQLLDCEVGITGDYNGLRAVLGSRPVAGGYRLVGARVDELFRCGPFLALAG